MEITVKHHKHYLKTKRKEMLKSFGKTDWMTSEIWMKRNEWNMAENEKIQTKYHETYTSKMREGLKRNINLWKKYSENENYKKSMI